MKSILKSTLLLALAINVLYMVLNLAMGNIKFGALDDYFMAAVLTGAHGNDYNPHLYFINAIYGYALLPLYHLFPKIGWYYIGEIFSVFISFTAITYILLKKVGKGWGLLLSGALLTFTSGQFYLSVQFTQCAPILAASGLSALLFGIFNKKNKFAILGAILFFWGSLMRWDAFLMGGPYFLATLIIQYKDLLQHKKIIFIYTISLFALIFGAKAFDSSLYDTEEYKPYKAIQGPRAAFGDGNDYNKNAVYEDLEEDNKFGDDYQMLTEWKFYDPGIFAIDSLLDILSYTHKYKNSISVLHSPLDILGQLSNSVRNNICCAFFILCFAILITNPKRGLYPWLALAITICLIAYLMFINRLVLRVENGLWIYATFLACSHLKTIKPIPSKFFTPVFALLIASTIYTLLQTEPIVKKQELYNKVFEYINSKPNTIFLVSMPQYSMMANHKLPPYYAEPIGGFKRTISFGYWTPYLPEITQTLKEFGVTNPFKDMVNDNVIVIGDGSFKDYLERHYYDNISVDTVNRIGNVNFFKYSKGENK